MPIQDLTRPLDALLADRSRLQQLFLVLGVAMFLAFFLPWGIPGAGARWEMDFFVDIWPFLWAFGFGAVGAAKLLKLPFRPRPFGMGIALVAFGGLGLLVVSLKLAGEVPGFMNAILLGTHPFLVTGALGHLGLFTVLVALYLRARQPEWSPARYVALAGGGLLLLGILLPGRSSFDAFPIAALFRQTSGLGVLYSLYCLACLLATLGLAASPLVPREKLPPMLRDVAPLMLLSLLPLAWLLFWILGGKGAWQDIYSIPHRILTFGGLLVSLCLGAELVVRALESTARDRFLFWDVITTSSDSGWDPEGSDSDWESQPAQAPPQRSGQGYAAHQPDAHGPAPHQPYANDHQPGYPEQESRAGAASARDEAESPCPVCGSDLEWIAEYERWYCHRCSQYL